MAIRLLPEARDDLRDAIRYYREIKPPAVGMQLAARMLAAFVQALRNVESMPLSRPLHPDVPHIANLASISLTPEEAAGLARELVAMADILARGEL